METIISVEVPINRFEILSVMPNAWQLLLQVSLGVVKGDKIRLIEIDGVGSPTGNNKFGTVVFVNVLGVLNFDVSLRLNYIEVDFGIGFRRIGSTFYVG